MGVHKKPMNFGLGKAVAEWCVIVSIAVQVPTLVLAQAGPPFLSNDPGTPGRGNWEINIASAQTINHTSANYQLPQLDLNLGLGERIQLTFQVPYVVQTQADRSLQTGWSNAYAGVKWRFLDQGEGGWQGAVFPQLETDGLTSAKAKGIAVSGPRVLLPLELSKRLGRVDVDLEAGYYLPKDSLRERILGLVVGQALSKRLDVAVELYNDRISGASPPATTMDIGGRFKLRRGFIALFMAGRSVTNIENGPNFIGYVGVQILLSDYGRALESVP